MSDTRSRVAFLMSSEKLFGLGERVYFWTFTFKNVHPDWFYPVAWREFAAEVGNLYGGYICGLRVIEPHESHGLHYHLLVNKRMSVHFIRRIAERQGMGRINVAKLPATKFTARYLSKYMLKDSTPLFGVKRWHTFGAFHGVRRGDIEVDSPYLRILRRCTGGLQLKIGWAQLLQQAYVRHDKPGVQLCWEYLHRGLLGSACKVVSPNVELTAAGGLRYVKVPPAIPYRMVKSAH